MADIHIHAISDDRYFSTGLHYFFHSCGEQLKRKIALTALPFEKENFEDGILRKIKNKTCDFLILDCSCGFINYYRACSLLYSAIVRKTLAAKVILFYENNLCLTNPDMYNHFITVDKNNGVEQTLLSMIRLFSKQNGHDEESSAEEETFKIRQYLTGRELIIIDEIYKGTSPNDIAKKLKLRIKTINSYKSKAMKKISSKRALDFYP